MEYTLYEGDGGIVLVGFASKNARLHSKSKWKDFFAHRLRSFAIVNVFVSRV
jgi:hypothetical protein